MTVKTQKHIRGYHIAGRMLALIIAVTVFGSSALLAKADERPTAFTKYDVSASGGFAIGITVDGNGNPWFGLGNGSIGTINHRTGALKTYPLTNANAGVGTIKVDDNGIVWFTEGNAPGIGKLNPTTGKETEFLLPTASRGLTPTFLALGKGGNVWFNETDYSDATGGKLARLSPNGVITEWAVPTAGAELEEIALDQQGNLWFAEQGNTAFAPSPNKVGKLNPEANTITEYTSPTPNSRPAGIVVAPDNTIWFSEHATDKIAHLFPKKAVGVTSVVTPIATGATPTISASVNSPATPTNPVTTPSQATTTTSQTTPSQGIVEYSLPHSGSPANTEDIRFDHNGNLFFENDATGQIGELILCEDTATPTIRLWSIPQGKGFYNIEFNENGTVLWISDTAGFGTGGSVYKFTV